MYIDLELNALSISDVNVNLTRHVEDRSSGFPNDRTIHHQRIYQLILRTNSVQKSIEIR